MSRKKIKLSTYKQGAVEQFDGLTGLIETVFYGLPVCFFITKHPDYLSLFFFYPSFMTFLLAKKFPPQYLKLGKKYGCFPGYLLT